VKVRQRINVTGKAVVIHGMVRERLTNLLTAKIAARGFLGTVYLISFACPSSGARCDAKLLERPSWFAPEFRENYYLRHVLNDWNVLNDLERALSIEVR